MKILLIGCGKMGSALYKGWLKGGIYKDNIETVDPVNILATHKSLSELDAEYKPGYVILAVKPQNLEEISGQLERFAGSIIISIIAGKTIKELQNYVGNTLVIRTMPNLAATIGKGAIAAVPNRRISELEMPGIMKILQPCGKVIWLNSEEEIDAVTAVSGSGPAYVFLFAESMIEAGKKLGLSDENAKDLVLETLKGSVELAQTSDENLEQLKRNVTSKGGTTEAALKLLENGDVFKKLMNDAIKEAHLRAKELAK